MAEGEGKKSTESPHELEGRFAPRRRLRVRSIRERDRGHVWVARGTSGDGPTVHIQGAPYAEGSGEIRIDQGRGGVPLRVSVQRVEPALVARTKDKGNACESAPRYPRRVLHRRGTGKIAPQSPTSLGRPILSPVPLVLTPLPLSLSLLRSFC